MQFIHLACGLRAIVDDEDFENKYRHLNHSALLPTPGAPCSYILSAPPIAAGCGACDWEQSVIIPLGTGYIFKYLQASGRIYIKKVAKNKKIE